MRNPQECRFTKTHEWVASDGTVGISDHAQKEITDVVFVDLPKIGKVVKAGDPVAVIESVKAAFDIYAPMSGEIVKVNTEVSKNPALVNQSAYDRGWSRLAPGMVLVGDLIMQAIEEGCAAFDMLKGDLEYKYRFGAAPRHVKRLMLRRG